VTITSYALTMDKVTFDEAVRVLGAMGWSPMAIMIELNERAKRAATLGEMIAEELDDELVIDLVEEV